MITEKIVSWLIRQKMITHKEREVYIYAVQSFYFCITPLVLSILIGRVMNQTMEGLILGFIISVIRRYSGGYHANSVWKCHILSIIILIIGLFIVSYIHIEICFFIGEIGAVLSLWILSPVESKNRPLNGWEKKQYKKITIVITLICMWIEIIFSLCDRKSFAIAIGTGVMVKAITQSSYWLKIKKERRR